VRSSDDRCESATIIGRLTYTENEDDVTSIPFGGSALLWERTASGDRAISLTRGADGQIVRSFQVNGRTAPFDGEAQRWLSAFLPRVLMMSGINVGPRVARWKAKGGVDNVLRNIEQIESSGAMRAHYEELIAHSRLTDDETDRTIRSLSDHMRMSSGDLRTDLLRLTPSASLSSKTISSLERAMTSIPSSGDKATVLQHFGFVGSQELLAAVIRAAETIPSSGDKRRVLQSLAAPSMNADAEVRRSWFAAARSIPSLPCTVANETWRCFS
jgi:hypothetical protein